MSERIARHAPFELPVRPVLFGSAVIVVAVVVAVVAMNAWTARLLPDTTAHVPAAGLAPLPLEPGAEVRALRARWREELATWGWADRPRGLVRMPIEDAMRALVAEGLPAVDQPQAGDGEAAP